MARALIIYDRIVEQGGDPDQRDALIQAREVAKALSAMGWDPVEAACSLDLAGFAKQSTSNPEP